MSGRRDEQLAHALWWLFHAAGLAAVCYLPSDFRISEGITAQHWVVALALSFNVLTHYHVRFSDPGYAPLYYAGASTGSSCNGGGHAAPAGVHAGQHAKDCEAGPHGTIAANGPHVCSQCGAQWRQPATVHCRFCGRCVEGFDHHCIWLGACVGGRNHHLFARYTLSQAVVCALGFHYALTACGRRQRGGGSWAYALLAVMGVLTLLVGCLAATHVFLVLTGQTTRQVVQRLRAGGAGGGGGGGGRGVAARLGSALRRTLPPASAPALAGQQSSLSAGLVLQKCAMLVCGVRPAWLAGHSPWLAAVNGWVATACSNRYYSCC